MYVYIGMLYASADMLPGYKSLGTLEVSRTGRDGVGSGRGERGKMVLLVCFRQLTEAQIRFSHKDY